MLQHTKEGAMGLVVNIPTEHTLGGFAKEQEISCHQDLQKASIFQGGPVEPQRGWILHGHHGLEEKREIMPGIYLSGTMDSLKQLLEAGDPPVKFLLGYAGWEAGQLEEEMKQGSWLDAQAKAPYIFETNPQELWGRILRDMGIDPATLISAGGVH